MEVFLKTFELHCYFSKNEEEREIFLRDLFQSFWSTTKTTKLICNTIVLAIYVPYAHYSSSYMSSSDPMHS